MHSQEITDTNKKKTLIIIILTVVTMAAEIFYGYFTNSMALLADGYHMGTHALAFGLTYIAYVLSEKFRNSEIFPNGTDKIGILAGYTSSIFLGLTGIWIIQEAVSRFFTPVIIEFNQAVIVALIGLIINSICIFIMENKHHNKDYNFLSAYYHILADILTSVLAIFALIAGKIFNIFFLDTFVGILGGVLILRWSAKLIKDTAQILIDKNL